MKTKARKSCQNCSRSQAKLNAQQAELEGQKRRLAALEATVAKLQEQLAAAKKNSATSSKPPSSDIVKPKPLERSDGKKRHRQTRDTFFSAIAIDAIAPLSNFRKSLSTPSLKMTPFCGMCDTISRVWPGPIVPKISSAEDILLINGSRTLKHNCSAVASNA